LAVDQLELARLHNWEIACFLTLQNTASINADLMIPIRKVRSVAHQSASFYRERSRSLLRHLRAKKAAN
jgi:hypothetical protein